LSKSTSLSKSMQRCHEIIYKREDICPEDAGVYERFPYEKADGIGMIWYVSYTNGDTIVEHGGDYNHHCFFKFNKTKNAGVIMFTNTTSPVSENIKETIFKWITE
jgi:hypothetical protein